MPSHLPRIIEEYFSAKNRHDIDGMLAAFDESAVVLDEGETLRGRASIRAWIEKTTSKYRVTVKIVDFKHTGEHFVVSGLVSGTFPGSPATLNYTFGVSDGGILSLQID